MMSNLWESIFTALTQPVAGLVMATMLLLGVVLSWYQGLKMRRLEREMIKQQQFFRQELNMIRQSAMGVGSRVKYLEQKFKRQPTAFEQVLAKAADAQPSRPDTTATKPTAPLQVKTQSVPRMTPAPEMTASRAERALDRWLQDSRHIA